MTLQAAYLAALERPIKDLPFLRISRIDRHLYIEEDKINASLNLVNEPGTNDNTFYITAEELLSENWEVYVDKSV